MNRFCSNIIVLIFFVHFSAQGQVKQDKVLHFAAGAISGAAGAFIASEISNRNRFWTVTGAIAASLLTGLTKETLDKRDGRAWRNADVAATVLGGVTVGVSIELFSKKNGKYYVKKNKSKDLNQ